jgi:hypothetical protein
VDRSTRTTAQVGDYPNFVKRLAVAADADHDGRTLPLATRGAHTIIRAPSDETSARSNGSVGNRVVGHEKKEEAGE